MTRMMTLLEKVGLLAGQAQVNTALISEAKPNGRTCIDGGQTALVTISDCGPVGFAVPYRAEGGLQFWHRGCFATKETGESVMVTARDAAVRAAAKRIVGACNDNAMTYIERLAVFGQVYMVTPKEPETGASWISYQIHPRTSFRHLLADLGVSKSWPELRDAFSSLLARPVTESLRPWSISVETGSGRLRIGSSAWARLPESHEKSKSFNALMCRLGGLNETASAVYSLAARHALATDRPGRAGVAAEFDLEGTTIAGAHFTLRLNRND